MKKVVVAILVLALVTGAFVMLRTKQSPDEVELMPTVSRPDPSNATFLFEDGPITLEDGGAVTELAPGSAIVQETMLTDLMEYADVNGDGNNDTVVILMQDGGGSGIFVYVAAYLSGNVEYKGSNAFLIGDRVSPQEVSVSESGVITISYLDRDPSEPLAAEPTVKRELELVYRGGNLEER